MAIITIDPGITGVIVVNVSDKITIHKMPQTFPDTYNLLEEYKSMESVVCTIFKCYLEKVHGMPGQGGAAMFTFGRGYGWLEMALYSLKIPTYPITPQAWTKAMGLGTKKAAGSPTKWKNKLKQKAQQIYPSEKITLWNADGLLMMYYVKELMKS